MYSKKLTIDVYRKDIKTAFEQGLIVIDRFRKKDKWNHLRKGLSGANTRRLDDPIRKFLAGFIEQRQHTQILELGSGAGVAVSQMSDIGKEKVTIDTVALTEIAPSWKLRLTYAEIAEVYKRHSDKMGEIDIHKTLRIRLKDVIKLQNISGVQIFENCNAPFVRYQYIQDFSGVKLKEKYDFIHDSFGGLYYTTLHHESSDPAESFQNALSRLSPDGVLCLEHFEPHKIEKLKSFELPEGYEFVCYKRKTPDTSSAYGTIPLLAGFVCPNSMLTKENFPFLDDFMYLNKTPVNSLKKVESEIRSPKTEHLYFLTAGGFKA